MNATGGVGSPTPSPIRSTGEVTAVEWLAPALNTILLSLRRRRGPLHHHVRTSRLADVGVGAGRRQPMNFQQIDTVLAYLQSIQIPREDCLPEEAAIRTVRAVTCLRRPRPTSRRWRGSPSRTARTRRTAKRCSTSSCRAGPTAAPAATPRAGATATPASPVRARSAGTSPAARPPPSSPTARTMFEFVATGSENGVGYAPRRRAAGACPGSARAHRRAARSDHRVRAEPVMCVPRPRRPSVAIRWEPELRGILIVIIAVVVLCGSIYMIMATNLGARLGFLVALTGLAGWMALMGIIWMIYGIGLKGPEPSWEAVPGRTVLQDTDALYACRRVRLARSRCPRMPPTPRAASSSRLLRGGRVGLARRGGARFGQAASAAADVPRGDRGVRRRRVHRRQRVRHRGRALPEGHREPRLLRVLPQAALRARRGRPAVPTGPSRAGLRRPPRSTRPASTSTSTWSATSGPGGSRR